MDKQTFSSIQATTNTSRYAAAVFRKGSVLHLSTMLVFLFVSPCFWYLWIHKGHSYVQRVNVNLYQCYISVLYPTIFLFFYFEDNQICQYVWLKNMQTWPLHYHLVGFWLLFLCIGELHVTPLTGILQMRPSFSYLDKADNKTREREAANEGVSAFLVPQN